MMDNAKVGPKCKQLALNVLPKYVSKFPEMADSALDILIDLFEESDKVMVCFHNFCDVLVSITSKPFKDSVSLPAQLPHP